MVVMSEVTGKAGMPSKKEVQQFVREEKLSYANFMKKVRYHEQQGIQDAERIIAQARKSGNPRLMRSALLAAITDAEKKAADAEYELTKLKISMAVDALSFIDPTPVTTGFSIWLEMQD